FDADWHCWLRDGIVNNTGPANVNASAPPQPLSPAPQKPAPAIAPGNLALSFRPSASLLDGRYANNGWLQELPDPITKLTWDNAALISPAYAKKLGVLNGDLINIAINEKSAGGQPVKRELVIAALVSPGHANNSVSIPLGYGRKMPEFAGLPYAGGALKEKPGIVEQGGFNGYFLRTAANPHFAVAGGPGIENVNVTKV